MLLEVLVTEAGAAGGVDLDRARNAERIRILAFGRRALCEGGAARDSRGSQKNACEHTAHG